MDIAKSELLRDEEAPALPIAFHADQRVLAEHGRTVLRRDHVDASGVAATPASTTLRPPSTTTSSMACCRFRGHRDKVFMKLENLYDEKSVQPRVQAGSGGVDNETWR